MENKNDLPAGVAFAFKVQHERNTDAVVQLRCDSRTLATLAEFFVSQGAFPTAPVMVVRWGLEYLREILEANQLVSEMLSTSDAVAILQGMGLDKINPSGRGIVQRMKQLQRESLELEGMAVHPLAIRTSKHSMSAKLNEAKMQEIRQAAMTASESFNGVEEAADIESVLSRVPDNLVSREEEDYERDV